MNPQSFESLRDACLSPLPQPDAAQLRDMGAQVFAAILDDFLGLGDAGIGHTGSRPEMERLLRESPPEEGMGFGQLLADVQQKVIANSFRPSHPRFLAFIPGAPTFASILADCVASNANLFAGVWKESAGAAEVEMIVLDWFKQFLGYPAEARGLLTGGGSEANLTALVAAREDIPHSNRGRMVLYASEQRHWSIDRGAKIIGMSADQIRPIGVTPDFRLDLGALHEAVTSDTKAGRLPWLVVANAGATNTGAVDPLSDLADLCAEHRLWLHVDAAYGWSMCLLPPSPSERGAGGEAGLLQGIERADSITLDPHKWFAQPFEVGCVLVRQGELLARTFSMRPEYMQDVTPQGDEINFCDHGIALTRRFRALKIWFSVKMQGVAWFRRLVEHGCALAAFAQALLEKTGCFEITSARKLSIVCFRFVPETPAISIFSLDNLQSAIAEALMRDGRAFISTTRLGGQTTLRFCFVNWRTTANDVEVVVSLLVEIGARLALRASEAR